MVADMNESMNGLPEQVDTTIEINDTAVMRFDELVIENTCEWLVIDNEWLARQATQ